MGKQSRKKKAQWQGRVVPGFIPEIPMPKNPRFPLLMSEPLGLLVGTKETAYKAKMIRRKVLQALFQDAQETLVVGDTSSDQYHAYLRLITYLRYALHTADEWLAFEAIPEHADFLDILAIVADDFGTYLLARQPESEQEAVREGRRVDAEIQAYFNELMQRKDR